MTRYTLTFFIRNSKIIKFLYFQFVSGNLTLLHQTRGKAGGGAGRSADHPEF